MGNKRLPHHHGHLISFQKHWGTILPNLSRLVKDFYLGMVNLERINWANIVLIPKKPDKEDVRDFRPISLINFSLKIISKILANRLNCVINDLVDSTQSAFIKGRNIANNVTAAEELIFNIQSWKINSHIFKVDFQKSFNIVDWDFLFEILSARGIGWHWISWIKTILMTPKANILVNGFPAGYVRYQRGLRQGDPYPLSFLS